MSEKKNYFGLGYCRLCSRQEYLRSGVGCEAKIDQKGLDALAVHAFLFVIGRAKLRLERVPV